jgi:hypothetical protein
LELPLLHKATASRWPGKRAAVSRNHGARRVVDC